jgi:ADP-ribose pyrophosphatase YjhB (NUDIX family)
MLLYSMLALFVFAVYIGSYLVWLYFTAKPKHQKELVQISWFWKNTYGNTPIIIPRALIPFFEKFYFRFCGLTVQGSRVLIFSQESILFCKLAKERIKNNIMYDLGAGGVCPSGHTGDETAQEELYEELGVKLNLKYYKTVTPYSGYHCIIHIYFSEVDETTKFTSVDGTYEEFMWIKKNNWKKYEKEMRDDVRLMMKTCDFE